ncbi:hypothetical protein DB346_10955 [Verrucomicrobia bacterium LW23]|nr:hypothetical protein DB346_10955 [Verrucomicrobia bacterium LW23]
MDSFDMARRMYRWLIAFFGVCLILVMFAWLAGLRFQLSPWDFHLSRMQAGKSKAAKRLAGDVWLVRTRSAAGLHHSDGRPIVDGVIRSIGYDAGLPDTIVVEYSKAPSTTYGGELRGQLPMARVSLRSGAATQLEDQVKLKYSNLQPIDAFFPAEKEGLVP